MELHSHQQQEHHPHPQQPTLPSQLPPQQQHHQPEQQQHHQHHQQPQPQPPSRPPLVPIAPMPLPPPDLLTPALVHVIQREMAEHKAAIKREIEEFRRDMLAEVSKRQRVGGGEVSGRGRGRKTSSVPPATASAALQRQPLPPPLPLPEQTIYAAAPAVAEVAIGTMPNITEGSEGAGGGGDGGGGGGAGGEAITDGMESVMTPMDYAVPDVDIPNYELSLEIKSVRDLFVEWMDGWNGGPSVKSLIEKYDARWRKTDKARQHWCRREAVYRELIRLARAAFEARNHRPPHTADMSEVAREDYEEAVAELDGLMSTKGLTINKLAEYLKRPDKIDSMEDVAPDSSSSSSPDDPLRHPMLLGSMMPLPPPPPPLTPSQPAFPQPPALVGSPLMDGPLPFTTSTAPSLHTPVALAQPPPPVSSLETASTAPSTIDTTSTAAAPPTATGRPHNTVSVLSYHDGAHIGSGVSMEA